MESSRHTTGRDEFAMKTVKDAVYGFVQERVIGDSQYRDGVQTSEVAESLGLRRCNVSSLLNELVRDGKLLKTQTRPVLYRLPSLIFTVVFFSTFPELFTNTP